MIPLKLELRNFLSYGDEIQTIDFSSHHLICLSGRNGNGKSALLDGITWAVWGQARKIAGASKADEGLVRLGQTRMMASLTFSLNGKTYRTRREYAKTYGKPYAALDFELFDESAQKFVSLTDKTIRATQEKIERTLNLDYETFINSAFLRQGQANEFSKKSAKERKQILGTILGLARYDALQVEAASRAKKLLDEKNVQLQICKMLDEEINCEAELTAQLETTTTSLQAKQLEAQAAQKSITLLQGQLQALAEKNQLLQFLHKNLTTLSEQHDTAQSRLLEARSQWRIAHTLLLRQPAPHDLARRREELMHAKGQYIAMQQQKTLLEAELISLAKQQLQIETQLRGQQERELATLQRQLDQQRIVVNNLTDQQLKAELQLTSNTTLMESLAKNIQDLKLLLSKRQAHVAGYTALTSQFEKRKAFYQFLITHGNQVKRQQLELEQKRAIALDPDSPECPLCKQELNKQHRAQIDANMAREASLLTHQLTRAAHLIKKLKELLVAQNQEKLELEKQTERFIQAEASLQECERQLAALHATHAQLITLRQELIAQATLLQQQTILPLEQSLAELTAQNSAQNPQLAQFAQAQQSLAGQVQQLEAKLLETANLDQELAQLSELLRVAGDVGSTAQQQTQLQLEIKHIISTLRQYRRSMLELAGQLSTLQPTPDQEAQLLQTLQVALEQEAATQKIIAQLTPEKIGLEQQLTRIRQLKTQANEKQKSIELLNIEIEDYSTLSQVFGKNGIQALLIEEAIPEIEQEANTLLAMLTDNQSQLFIESLRDLKSGGVRETLEIKISDATGIRPYEMFSGGEAFRVDFALRIAISKLLARRAGTALQTLIIDEGFGSQDEEGLTRVMDALHAIQDNFSKIIIVSHLSEFKDNFPVHFIIEKTSMGSQVRVEERG